MRDKVSKIKPEKEKLNALSFFSGAMGLDIGLHKEGINTLLTCEVDKSSRETITSNLNEVGLIGDIRQYSVNEILKHANVSNKSDIDLIVGGPPCQAFSSAGKRLGFADERGNVFIKFIEIIEEISPKYIVIENVRGLLSTPYNITVSDFDKKFIDWSNNELKGSALMYIVNRLRNTGYNLSFNLYNSANFGTPQIRERLVIMGTLSKIEIPFLQPTHSESGEFGLKKWNTLKDVIGNLNVNHDFIKFPERRLKYYKMIQEGKNWRSLPIELQKEALGGSYYLGGGKTGFFRRLSWDRPSPTLVTHPAMPATDLGHPTEDRPLSVQEYKKIQEFPDNWVIKGSILNQYKQIGNAVPISLGRAIGKAIIHHNKDIKMNSLKGFKYSRYKNTNHIDFVNEFKKKVSKSNNEVSVELF